MYFAAVDVWPSSDWHWTCWIREKQRESTRRKERDRDLMSVYPHFSFQSQQITQSCDWLRSVNIQVLLGCRSSMLPTVVFPLSMTFQIIIHPFPTILLLSMSIQVQSEVCLHSICSSTAFLCSIQNGFTIWLLRIHFWHFTLVRIRHSKFHLTIYHISYDFWSYFCHVTAFRWSRSTYLALNSLLLSSQTHLPCLTKYFSLSCSIFTLFSYTLQGHKCPGSFSSLLAIAVIVQSRICLDYKKFVLISKYTSFFHAKVSCLCVGSFSVVLLSFFISCCSLHIPKLPPRFSPWSFGSGFTLLVTIHIHTTYQTFPFVSPLLSLFPSVGIIFLIWYLAIT